MSLINGDSLFRSTHTVSHAEFQFGNSALNWPVLCSWQKLKPFVFFVTGFIALILEELIAFILWKFGQLLNLGLRDLLDHPENSDLHQVIENSGKSSVRMLWGNWDEFNIFLKINWQKSQIWFCWQRPEAKAKNCTGNNRIWLVCPVQLSVMF